MEDNFLDKRSEPRSIIDEYYSVEFSLSAMDYLYQFKIWDLSAKGICLLVKEDSKVLECIHVGDVLDMKYYRTDSSKPADFLKTEIRHITKDDQGRFKGHYLVGLSILDQDDRSL